VGTATVPLSGTAPPRIAFRKALAEAAQRAAEGLAISVRADGKRVDGLVADLSAKDVRVREQAVRVLGERRSREAVPALVDLLQKEEPRLAHRIVGALAQIGDPRAVPPLIDLASGKDSNLVLRMLRFIGDIGGPEAEGYLLTLASGHPDPRVRQAAREALDDLQARAHETPPVAARK
jgi:HEAT repeat protein